MTWRGIVITARIDDIYHIAHVTLSGHEGSPGIALLTVGIKDAVEYFEGRPVELDIKLK